MRPDLNTALRRLAVCAALMAATLPALAQEQATRPAALNRVGTVAADYRIGPRDLLEISVFGVDDFDAKVRVSETGTVSLPLLGEVEAAGLTPAELETAIETELRRWLTEPDVSIFVESFESRTFTVMGAVETPGTYGMSGSETLLQALTFAGGVDTSEADGTVVIFRGTEDPVRVDLHALLYDPDPAFNLPVQPGDLINVISKPTYTLYVHGAVTKAGSFAVRERITLLQAITMAGGFADRAARDRVKILRRQADGTSEEIEVDVKKILEGKEPDFLLQANDIVVVPETFF